MGWAGIENGRLLQQAANDFDCFLTVDRNLQFQQSQLIPIAVLVVAEKTTSSLLSGQWHRTFWLHSPQ
jgi:hypothetical protein